MIDAGEGEFDGAPDADGVHVAPDADGVSFTPDANGGDFTPDANGVIRLTNRTLASNTWLVPLPEPGACVIIDPGLEDGLAERALEAAGLVPRAIIATHGHFDHLGVGETLRRRYGIPFHLHAADLKLARQANFLMTLCKIDARIVSPEVETPVGGDGAARGGYPDLPVGWIHAPGHTPGSCLVVVGDLAFSGDTIYRRGLDTLPLPGTDNNRMRASLLGLWDALDENIWIYPGHGAAAPFGDIKRHNLKLRAFLGLPCP